MASPSSDYSLIGERSAHEDDSELDESVTFHDMPALKIHTTHQEDYWDFDGGEELERRLENKSQTTSAAKEAKFENGRWQQEEEEEEGLDDLEEGQPPENAQGTPSTLGELEVTPALLESLKRAQVLHNQVFGS